MKINFERSGGFAGLKLAFSLDSDSLPADDAAALKKLVEDTDFFNLPEPEAGRGHPDGFQYAITVEQDGQQRTLRVSENMLPEKLRPLVNDLSIRARTQRR